jgi:hypothetical protein
MLRGVGRGAILLAGLTLAACGVGDFDGEELLREQLQAARDQWSSAGNEDYTMVIRRACGDCEGATQFARVIVRNNARESATFFDTGDPVSNAELALYPTVLELFEFLDTSLRQGADEITVQYDALLGFPTSIYVDRAADLLNDETAYTAHTVEPLAGS